MRRLNGALGLALAVLGLMGPICADRVDIADPTGLGRLVHSGEANLTRDFSAHLDMNTYSNVGSGNYSNVFTLALPAGLGDGPAFNVNPGALFDLANLNWGMVTSTAAPEMGVESAGADANGATFFIFSNPDRQEAVTVYGQSTRPPEEILASLSENGTHRPADGRIPPPVPEPGTLLLMGGGLALAARAIRRRLARRQKT